MIPRVIYQVWLGQKIPTAQTAIIKHNRNMCKKNGFTYKLIRDKYVTQKNFPNIYPYIQKLLKMKNTSKYAQVVDLLRYELLFRNGGVYADAGIEFVDLKKLDMYLKKAENSKKSLVLCHNDPKQLCNPFYCDYHYKRMQISNSFICSTKENDILGRTIKTKRLQRIKLGTVNVNAKTGPYYFRSVMRNTNRRSIMFLPSRLIFPFNWMHVVPFMQRDKYSRNKCVSYKKPNHNNYVVTQDQCNTKLYLTIPCTKYKNVIGIKHWDIGGSWVSKDFKNYECTRIKTL